MTAPFGTCENCGAAVLLVELPAGVEAVVDAEPQINMAEIGGNLLHLGPGRQHGRPVAARTAGLGSYHRRHVCQEKARATDPDTSKRAARAVRATSQRGRILVSMMHARAYRMPHQTSHPCLLAEGIAEILDLPLNSVSTRMSELVRGDGGGPLVMEGPVADTQHGTKALTYYLSAHGLQVARRLDRQP